MTSDPFHRLVDFAAGLSYEDLPAAVRHRAKLIFLHNLVVALAARPEHVAGQDCTTWPELDAGISATRLTDSQMAPTEMAIVTNSLAMGARAQHDEHTGAISHFGSTILPPLLAVAEQTGANGADVLAAMTAGYEVAGRIGALSLARTTARGFRPTSLYGPIGGAVAVGVLLGQDAETLSSAIAFAANASCGLTQTWLSGTDEWRYQTAFAARNGYVAAKLADQRLRGSAETLNGERGFHRAFAGETLDLHPLSAGLSQTWALDDVLLKPYPVCALNQAPIQQLIELRHTHGLDAADIAEIVLRMNPNDCDYPGVDAPGPMRTRAAALMSVQTCAAIAAQTGDVPLEWLDRPDDTPVRVVAERVVLQRDADVPSHASCVDLLLTSGVRITSGMPAVVRYDEATSRNLVAALQSLTGLAPEALEQVRATITGMNAETPITELFDLIRQV